MIRACAKGCRGERCVLPCAWNGGRAANALEQTP